MGLILSFQPDSAQSAALRAALRPSDAEIKVVNSVDDALTAIESEVPDLVLLDALLPPNQADDLVAHLRILSNAGHVQVIYAPLIQPAVVRIESAPPPHRRRRRHWLSHLLGKEQWLGHLLGREPARPKTQPVAWSPATFAEDVVAYMCRSFAVKAEIEDRNVRDAQPARPERRHAERSSPLDLSFSSAVGLATTSADLINLSSGGALVRCPVRPDPRLRSRASITLYLETGEAVHRTGRPIRCHVRSVGEASTLYDVAYQFDDMSLCLP